MTKVAKAELLTQLYAVHAVVLNPTLTDDMGLECTIASNRGVKYASPGMFLNCSDGHWPIECNVSKTDASGEKYPYLFRNNEEDIEQGFSDSASAEAKFVSFLGTDQSWAEFDVEDLEAWLHTIQSDGVSIIDFTVAYSEYMNQ